MKDSNVIDAVSANRRVLALIALVALAGLAGCLSGGEESPEQETQSPEPAEEADVFGEVIQSNDGGEVHRFVDEEAGTVCYIFDEEGAIGSGAGWQSGMTCVPIEQTNFAEEDI